MREGREIAVRKVKPLCEHLARDYGIVLDLTATERHLTRVMNHYLNKRQSILSEQGEFAAMRDPNYAKAVLISETVRLFLREIAPKRLGRKKKN